MYRRRTQQVRVPDLQAMKQRGEKITMLTAYDATIARILDRAGVDVILVGDSLGMVVLGYETTLPVTIEAMIHHTAAVTRGVSKALVVADMPFLTYQVSTAEAVRNAGRLIQEGGASAVKLEGGHKRVQLVKRLVDEEIAVMGHIGLTPQSINQLGNYRVQGKTADAARGLLDDAHALEEAGAFSIVLELVPREIAQMITESIRIPTIGIGAGVACDIQVLVFHDLLGMAFGKLPRFVREYANLRDTITDAVTRWAEDVRSGSYPSVQESYGLPAEAAAELNIETKEGKLT